MQFPLLLSLSYFEPGFYQLLKVNDSSLLHFSIFPTAFTKPHKQLVSEAGIPFPLTRWKIWLFSKWGKMQVSFLLEIYGNVDRLK